MIDFIEKHKEGKFKIYKSHEIASWFTTNDLADDLKDPYLLI